MVKNIFKVIFRGMEWFLIETNMNKEDTEKIIQDWLNANTKKSFEDFRKDLREDLYHWITVIEIAEIHVG
jgi:hypothetical protein